MSHKAAKLVRFHAFDVNIFLEDIDPNGLSLAPVNLLIPNPEWLVDQAQPHLGSIDAVLCKTHHAEQIYRPLAKRVEYSSFTSLDRKEAGVESASRAPTTVHRAQHRLLRQVHGRR